LIYFLIYLFLEVVISVNLFSALDGVGAFVEIILSGILGIVLLANTHNTMTESLNSLVTHRISHQTFTQVNTLNFIGALLLIIPGILTDTIGVLLQFSVITSLIVARLKTPKPPPNNHQEQDVIDVEIIESNVSDSKGKYE